MTLALDHFPQPDSPLSRLDPRWKLAAFALAILSVALLHTLTATALAMAGALLLVVLAGLSFRWYLYRLGGVGLFLVMLVAVLPFILHDGGPSLALGSLRISWHGLRVAGFLSL